MPDPIVVERVIPAGPDEAFALVTEPHRLRSWQSISAAVDLRVGGDYRFTMGPSHTASGRFTEVEPGRRVVFTWGWENSETLPPGASTVHIDLEPHEAGTLVRLTHSGLDDETAASHTDGWGISLDRLAGAAAGEDLPLAPFASPPDELDLLSSAEASWALCQHVMKNFTTDDREKPTPCAEFTVHELVTHLIESTESLGGMAGASFPGEYHPKSAEDHLAKAVEPALAAWRARGTDGSVPFGPGDAPAAVPAGILSLEYLIHAWDFSRATGYELDVPDHLAEFVFGIAETIIQPDNRGEGKGFADPTSTSSLDPMTRLAAFTGRAT